MTIRRGPVVWQKKNRKLAVRIDRKRRNRQNRIEFLFEKYEGCCAYCWRPVRHPDDRPALMPVGSPPEDLDATEDHVVPKSAGGRRVRENLVLACFGCNGRKKDKPVDQFLEEHAAILAALRVEAFLRRGGWYNDNHDVNRMLTAVVGLSHDGFGQPYAASA